MESAFFYFILGLLVFVVKVAVTSLRIRLRLFFFALSGMAGSMGIALLAETPLLPGVLFPIGFYGLTGLGAGLLLFAIDHLNLVHSTGFEYIVTIVSGLIYGGFMWLLAELYLKSRGMMLQGIPPAQKGIIFASFGFVTMAGFIFPERWFRRSREGAERFREEDGR